MRSFSLTALMFLLGCAAAFSAANAGDFKAPAGFVTQVKGGATYYCRTIAQAGSHLAQEQCFTQAEIKDMQTNDRALRDRIAQKSRFCEHSCDPTY
jgi:invasion protein IalB